MIISYKTDQSFIKKKSPILNNKLIIETWSNIKIFLIRKKIKFSYFISKYHNIYIYILYIYIREIIFSDVT
jgi:hypothetical protein